MFCFIWPCVCWQTVLHGSISIYAHLENEALTVFSSRLSFQDMVYIHGR